jgi:hypothetical protein
MNPIERVVSRDRKYFENWCNDPRSRNSLDIPYTALRYLALPLRVLQLAESPSDVDVLEDVKSEDYLSILIYNPTEGPVSSLDDIKKLQTQGWSPDYGLREGYRVDPFHYNWIRLIEEGDLSVNDFVWGRVSMKARYEDELHVISYEDRPEFRNKGVAGSFYNRLRFCAARLGFRYITGLGDSDRSFNYFKRMGRFPLHELERKMRAEFESRYFGDYDDMTMFTVDFLDPRDIAKFTN